MTDRESFDAWWVSAPHRHKYDLDHPVYLAGMEAWQSSKLIEREACANIIRSVDLSKIAGTGFDQYTVLLCTALEEAIRNQPKE